MHTQRDLHAILAQRLAESGKPAGLTAFAVIRELDLEAYVKGALTFALAQPPSLQRAWYHSFTRTAFLAGNYSRFASRYPAEHATRDGSVGWFGPASPERFEGLRRLLRAFTGAATPQLPPGPTRITVPGEREGYPRRRRLTVRPAGLNTLQYLVHLNHAICEAALLDLVRPGNCLELVHHDEIDEPPERWDYARVGTSPSDASKLRLYACLTTVK